MSDIRAQEHSDPLRPSRIALIFDFPDGETPWTYGGFAPGPPLGYTGNPSGSGGWLEADDLPIHAMRTTAVSEPVIEVVAPLVEEVREPVEPIVTPGTEEIVGPTEPMDAPTIDGDEDMEPLFSISDGEYDPDLHTLDDDDIAIEVLLDDSDMDDSAVHMDPVVAPVVPSPLMTKPPPLVAIPESSVHEVGGSSTAADVRLPSTVEELHTRMDDIGPRVIALEGHTQETLIHMVQDRDAQIEQLNAEMVSVLEREYGLMQMIATMSKRLADVEKRIPGPPYGLEATIYIMDYGFGHDVLVIVMNIGMDIFMVNLGKKLVYVYNLYVAAASEPFIEVVAPLVEEVRELVEPIVAPIAGEIVEPMEPMDAPMIGGDEDMEPLFSASDGEYDPDLHTLDDDDIAIEVLLDDSDMDDSAVHMDPVVAPVVPSPLMTTPPPLVAIPKPSVHEVGGSSTAADVRLPSNVEELHTRMDDVGFRHDVLVTRVDTVRDAVTAIGAVVGEIGPRVIALEGHTQETLIHMVQDRDAQIEQLSAEMVSVLEREYGLMQMIATMSKRLADVEKRIPGPP
ncbi:hypothetical protein Tco_0044456 [Tanacetum coccineum]